MPLSISPIPTKATHGCTWSKQPNSFPSRQAREAKCTFRQDRASRLTSVCGLSSLGHLVYPFFSLLPVLAPERSGCSTFWAGGGFLRVCPYPLFSLLQLGTQDGMYKGVKLRMYWDEGQWKDLQCFTGQDSIELAGACQGQLCRFSQRPALLLLLTLAVSSAICKPLYIILSVPNHNILCNICFNLQDMTVPMLSSPRVPGKLPGGIGCHN